MKSINFYLFFLLVSFSLQAQISENDTTKMGYVLPENDTILSEPIQLEEVVIFKEKLDPESKKQFLLLQNRVYKTYPFARIASQKLLALNNNMDKLKTNKEKKKYFKIVENYMENEFTGQLKKLSRKQGQILVKLICRQTGFSTYDLIKDYKSGWTAFWSNNTARVFDINLKTKYAPNDVNEDYLIETILYRAFNKGRLISQEAAIPIDYDALSDLWEQKAIGKK